jgi:hypothetical protein
MKARHKGLYCLFLYSYFALISSVVANENEAEKLLLAYDEYRDSWLASEIMIWCSKDRTKFKLSKNAFGKETLYMLERSDWKRVNNIEINGYTINWNEKYRKIKRSNIIQNATLCKGKDRVECFMANWRKVETEFLNIWKKNYHPSLISEDFEKYFTITSTSHITNSLIIDEAFYSSKFDDNIQKIRVTVSGNVSNPPDSLRRQTVDEYSLGTKVSGNCRLVE